MNKPRKMHDPQGREVLLSEERWRHIVSAHPEIEVYEEERKRFAARSSRRQRRWRAESPTKSGSTWRALDRANG